MGREECRDVSKRDIGDKRREETEGEANGGKTFREERGPVMKW